MKMKKFKELSHKLLFPKTPLILLLTVISAALLVFVFSFGKEQSAIACISYVISAYSLTVCSLRMPAIIKSVKKLLYSQAFSRRFLTDGEFRTKVMLRSGFAIHTIYSVFKFISGIFYNSLWFGAESVYHILISIIQLLILRSEQKKNKTKHDEWKLSLICGILMLLLNITISIFVFSAIFGNKSYVYSEIIIYATAAYTFYRIISTAIQIVKFRKSNKPLISASKFLNLSAALMSLFALQTAMLTQFGSESINRTILNGFTGISVCLSVIYFAASMIIRATKEINKTKTKPN